MTTTRTFETLPALWATVADVLSGLAEPDTGAGFFRYLEWYVHSYSTPGFWDVGVSAGTFTVTLTNAADDQFAFECPAPANTPEARAACFADPDWHRCWLWTSASGGGPLSLLPDLKSAIVDLLFTGWSWLYDPFSLSLQAIGGEQMLLAIRPRAWSSIDGLTFDSGLWTATGSNVQFDLNGWIQAGNYPMGDPVPFEPFASILQFPAVAGSANVDEVSALHNLAEAMRDGAGEKAGQVANGRGDQLLKLEGRPGTLPSRLPTLQSAMRRLAEAARLWCGTSAVLTLPSRGKGFPRGSRAQVAIQSGLLVLDDE